MKKNYRNHSVLSLFLIVCCTIINPVFSQEYHCGTTQATRQLYLQHPELIQQEAAFNTSLNARIANASRKTSNSDDVYIIPVVFHVIHANGDENISDAQIQNQIDILNNDYRKLNADIGNIVKNTAFDTLAADIKIEFRLAQIDPQGNCTNGIDRIYSRLTYAANDASKLNQWPREKYLNVWTVKTIGSVGVAGYAYLPSNTNSYLYIYDGILILSDYIGSIGTGSLAKSRALTHEIGHYLSLYHPWGSNNSPGVDCSGDDQVADVPRTKGHTTCDLYTPTCTIYPINNAYTFKNVTLTSGATDPTIVPVNAGASFGSFTAAGLSLNSMDTARFAFSGWDKGGAGINHDTAYALLTGTVNTSKFYEVTISPKFANSLTLTKLTFKFKRDSAGVRTFAVRSSLDGYATNLPASVIPSNASLRVKPGNIFFSQYDTTITQNGNTITLSTAFKNLITPVTFRFYGWNAEDSTGTFGIDSLVIAGSAGIIENTQNYMDYSYCSIMFTKGQKARIRATLESSISGRNNLWSLNNLIATGTNGNGVPCAATPQFYSNGNSVICVGEKVSFKSSILNTIPNSPVTILWDFQGGNPVTSAVPDPVVTYSTPGYYTVTLTVTNTAGTKSITKYGYVFVREPNGEFSIRNESFENADDFSARWHKRDYENNQGHIWEWANVGYNSEHSIRMNAYKNLPSDLDELISPSFNLFLVKNLKLSFRCAAATCGTVISDINDALKVYYSYNCGSTWNLTTINLSGAVLNNNGYHPELYVPTSPTEWALYETAIPPSATQNPVVFKFEYLSGAKSNNVYIDDINLSGIVGVDENTLLEGDVTIFPNPANETTTVSYRLNQTTTVKLDLTDVLGKHIATLEQGNQVEGNHSITLSKEQLGLQNGVYFIQIHIGKSILTKKLLIAE